MKTLTEKLTYLQDNHFKDWLKTRQTVEDEISARQTMFCICKRLATGLHEMYCNRFKKAVMIETVNRMAHLIK